jgi:hypothetical protein
VAGSVDEWIDRPALINSNVWSGSKKGREVLDKLSDDSVLFCSVLFLLREGFCSMDLVVLSFTVLS